MAAVKGMPTLHLARASLLLALSVLELSLAYVLLRQRSPRLRRTLAVARRLLPALAWNAVVLFRRHAIGTAAAASTIAAGPRVASLLWTGLVYQVPLPLHIPTIMLEWLLMYASSAMAAGVAPLPTCSALLQLAQIVVSSTLLVQLVQLVVGSKWPLVESADASCGQLAAAAGIARAASGAGGATLMRRAGSKAEDASIFTPAPEPAGDRADAGAPPAKLQSLQSAASRFLEGIEGSWGVEHVSDIREADESRRVAVAAAAQMFGYSVAAAVADAPPGGARPLVPYKGMCTVTPVGIKVQSPSHLHFDATAAALTAALAGTTQQHFAGAAALVNSTCVAGCVQLLGSVLSLGAARHRQGGEQGPSLAAALAQSIKQPLERVYGAGTNMPPVRITAAGEAELGRLALAPQPEAAAAPATLLACQPPCLAEGSPLQLRLLVQRPAAVAPALARVLVFGADGQVLLDQDAGQLGPGHSVLSVDAPDVPLTTNVTHVALLVGGAALAFVQPLPVLPAAAAAELQQLWVEALAAAAPAGDDSSLSRWGHAPLRGGSLLALSAPHVAEAWQQHLAPLVLDLSYVLLGGGMLPDGRLEDASSSPVPALVQHLSAGGLCATLNHMLQALRQRQALKAVSNMRTASSVVRRSLLQAWSGVAFALGSAATQAAGALRRRPASRRCEAAVRASLERASSSRAHDICDDPPGTCPTGSPLALLWGGFRAPGEEDRFLDFQAQLMHGIDCFTAFFHLILSCICLRALRGPYYTPQGVATTLASYVVPSLALLWLAHRGAGAARRAFYRVWVGFILATTLVVFFILPSYFPLLPVVMKPFGPSAGAVDHAVYVVKTGVLDALFRPVGWRVGVFTHAATGVLAAALGLTHGMAPWMVVARQVLVLVVALAVSGAAEMVARRMYVGSLAGKARGKTA